MTDRFRRLVTLIATPVLALLDHLSPLDLLPDTEAADEREPVGVEAAHDAANEVMAEWHEWNTDWALYAAEWEIDHAVWLTKGMPS